jgi:hypothetical protein
MVNYRNMATIMQFVKIIYYLQIECKAGVLLQGDKNLTDYFNNYCSECFTPCF